jgi:epidermal growth factor receptor substrate 15
MALAAGPLPKFEGRKARHEARRKAPSEPSTSLTPNPQIAGSIRIPPLSLDKAVEYAKLWEVSGAQNGILPSKLLQALWRLDLTNPNHAVDTAKNIFQGSRLSDEVLKAIWGLVDTQSRGALNMTEFVCLLHLIASYKTGIIQAFPQVLHPDLFEAAIRGFAALQRGKMLRTLSSPAGLQSNSAELRGFDIRSQP